MCHLVDTSWGAMVFWFLLSIFRALLTGLVLGVAWWLWSRRAGFAGVPGRPNRILAVVAGLIPIIGIAAERSMQVPGVMPLYLATVDFDVLRGVFFALPIMLGVVSLIVLAFPTRSRGGQGAATLTPRTPASFGTRAWFITPALVLVGIVIVTVIAGLASQPDSVTGRYTMYFVELGAERGMGTSIYGWFYSVPSMILLAVLALVTLIVLWLIARPAFGPDYDKDVQERTVRTRNVLAMTTGTLLVHLGTILESLGGSAAVRSSFTADGGIVTAWTPFAALESALFLAGGIAVAVGVAAWTIVVLSAVPNRQRVLSAGVSA